MSNFLAVDTSSKHLTVLAVKGEKCALLHSPDCAMKHSVKLMDEVDKALKQISLSAGECDFFSAVTGPGSFTGIRIGISCVKGFAVALNKPLLPITAFDLAAYNVTDENFYTVVDAGHNHYYVCGYANQSEIILPPSYMSREEVENLSGNLYGFEKLGLKNYTALQAGDCLMKAVLGNTDKLCSEIYALYVRKSQAEEGRK